jgi:predicted RNA-binding Zn-ribbon protein involved in translation (DUF1610 family)
LTIAGDEARGSIRGAVEAGKIQYALLFGKAYAMKPAASWLEAEMTSDIGVENVVEQPFVFQCSCGTTIETTEKKEICPNCGETIEVVRCVPTPNGKKYTLRISKHPNGWNAQAPLWPPVLQPRAIAQPTLHHQQNPDYNELFRGPGAVPLTWRQLESADYNKRCLRRGLLILLAPLWVPLLLIGVSGLFAPVTREQDRSNARTIEMPEPTDCGLFSGCHYEKRVNPVNDKRGSHTVVTWERVND